MTPITIAYRDMLAPRAKTIIDDLCDIAQPLQAVIKAEIDAGTRNGVTHQMTRWEALTDADVAIVDVTMLNEEGDNAVRAFLILPWEQLDESFDNYEIGTDDDAAVYAEIIAAVKRGKTFGYIVTNDSERVVSWNRFDI